MIRYRLRNETRAPFPCPEGRNPVLHRLLVQRGISSESEARKFLNPSAEDLYDPMRLSAMPEAVSRIQTALDAGEAICVYGDYDVDGVSASSILSDYLKRQGGRVEVYLPSRHTEGYGLNEHAVREIAQRCQLLVTVDCGVTSVELVDLAKSLGLDVLVTDHHTPAETLPDCPVVNPLLADYPFPYLCGAGVAFKLVWALGGREAAMAYIDIAALATVADVVPLTDENRVIVKLGLDRINADPRPGMKALIDVSGLTDKRINAGNIGFQLGPRLNAGGRLGSARRSFDLLLSESLAEARPIAQELEEENQARRSIEQEILAEAEKQLENFDFPAHRILILSGQDWNPGVIGLAAGRLVEQYHYPAIVLSERGGILTGSCRSIPGVNIHTALTAVQDCLIRYGGHKQAAGLTLESGRLDEMRERLDQWLFENIPAACYVPEQEYDMLLSLDELSVSSVSALDALQPTGYGNPAPVLRSTVQVYDARAVGLEGAHLRLLLSENGVQRTGIFFRAGSRLADLPAKADILYTPKLNSYMGRISVQIEIKEFTTGDVLSEIDAKIPNEDDLQREFLTEMLYNNTINPTMLDEVSIGMDALKALLNDPQGTLVLAGDLAIARQIMAELGDAHPDFAVRALPDDPRGFNAVAVYPAGGPLKGYRRLVLAGLPAASLKTEGMEIYRLGNCRASWLKELPDLEALRSAYKGVRRMLRSAERWESVPLMIHIAADNAGLSYTCMTACLIVLSDLDLVSMDLNAVPPRLEMAAMHKIDPCSSAVWRTIQSWRAE